MCPGFVSEICVVRGGDTLTCAFFGRISIKRMLSSLPSTPELAYVM